MKPKHASTARSGNLASWLFGLGLWAAAEFVGAAAPAELTAEQRGWLSSAERHARAGWTYLHIEGSPRQRGFQHGYLLATKIAEDLRLTRALWEHDSAMEWSWLVGRSKTLIEPRVDGECLGEIDGIVEGMAAAGVASSRSEMVAYNAWYELDWYWWPNEKKRFDATAPHPVKQSCSSFIATGRMTADHGVVLGHNSMVDYPEAYFDVILDVRPERGHRILMQTAPGLIHSGTDFFVTDAGLVGSETTIGSFDRYDEKGVPEFARMRRATQDSATIDEWCATMRRGNNGGYANAWLVGDVNSGEIARLELGLKFTNVERTHDGFFVGSNIAENPKILRFETDSNENDVRISSVARRARWTRLMEENAGRITAASARRFESDHFDEFLGKTHPGSRSLCGHFELEGPLFWGPWPPGPHFPAGTFDGKVVDASMARKMSFSARWGAACGRPFDAEAFLAAHRQFDWMKGLLKSRPTQPWAVFTAGERN